MYDDSIIMAVQVGQIYGWFVDNGDDNVWIYAITATVVIRIAWIMGKDITSCIKR